MIAIMISGKPKWSALIMNGDKTVEVRKNKGLYKAIQKLINEYGYAEIYWYCSKNEYLYRTNKGYIASKKPLTVGKGTKYTFAYSDEGKVLFKFRCYKVEEIEDFYSQENEFGGLCESYGTKTLKTNSLLSKAQLDYLELADYLNDYTPFGYAIHISNLEIFDKPKELIEFGYFDKNGTTYHILTKAPQNFCYVEVE